MAILCPRCGRGYDVALFPFGRTIACACGTRVGLRLGRRQRLEESDEPRFLADAMLGRLARWLRALGYDTEYRADASDDEAVARAVREERLLLTRDRLLPEEWWVDGIVLLRSEAPREQLRELAARLGLRADRPLFTRCTVCNTPLEPAVAAEVVERLPPRVRLEQPRLARCPGCERVYWEGSHTARMRAFLQEVLSEAGAHTRPS